MFEAVSDGNNDMCCENNGMDAYFFIHHDCGLGISHNYLAFAFQTRLGESSKTLQDKLTITIISIILYFLRPQ